MKDILDKIDKLFESTEKESDDSEIKDVKDFKRKFRRSVLKKYDSSVPWHRNGHPGKRPFN